MYSFSVLSAKKAGKKNQKPKKKQKKNGQKKSVFKRICIRLGQLLLVFFAASILLTVVYRWVNPPVTPLMLIRKATQGASIQKKWVDIQNLSPYLIEAAVASEDNFFLAHHGFDFGAIEKAIEERKTKKRFRGASTISQQTAKNVFLWSGRSWIRKGLECYFTVLIELLWSKERIMEVYLNIIETGNGIYGCEMASEVYFNKTANKLSRKQAALITACYPNPRKWNPSKPTTYIQNRASQIVQLTTLIGKIQFDKEHIQKAQERYEKYNRKRKKQK
jgi:monofunctional biosynthetic peptidoglycan transglycosylase